MHSRITVCLQRASSATSLASLPRRAPSATANTVEQLADKALAAFIIIHAMLKRSKRLHTYCQRPEILERMPGYEVRAST